MSLQRRQARRSARWHRMSSNHVRNTGPMRASRRCGARTRHGGPCCAPAMRGRSRCRMHGGAPGSRAPRGNRNAWKHGFFTRTATAERDGVRALLDQAFKLLRDMP
ncbi:HGGxSTG domain-containing protein [Bradyrhizobium sp. CCGB01]|uniref:HGGxSTG domain-containing protein n=1 Tax=Bradyrhizobium sp. CCGB01 TaxID=2949634 RepID=UPI002811764C|nr:HGGxSTG domain-containing protein [Bradyrhizobium sp. CCGB01]